MICSDYHDYITDKYVGIEFDKNLKTFIFGFDFLKPCLQLQRKYV